MECGDVDGVSVERAERGCRVIELAPSTITSIKVSSAARPRVPCFLVCLSTTVAYLLTDGGPMLLQVVHQEPITRVVREVLYLTFIHLFKIQLNLSVANVAPIVIPPTRQSVERSRNKISENLCHHRKSYLAEKPLGRVFNALNSTKIKIS